jgi:amidophosphoribosyltransferase
MLRESGAKEIHLRVGSPPITHSCFYGVDTPEREGLISAQKTTKELSELLGCDTLAFLSHAGLEEALSESEGSYCYGCFTGDYEEEICQEITPQPTDVEGPGTKSF